MRQILADHASLGIVSHDLVILVALLMQQVSSGMTAIAGANVKACTIVQQSWNVK